MRWFVLPVGVAAFYEVLELDEAGAEKNDMKRQWTHQTFGCCAKAQTHLFQVLIVDFYFCHGFILTRGMSMSIEPCETR